MMSIVIIIGASCLHAASHMRQQSLASWDVLLESSPEYSDGESSGTSLA